MCDLITSGKLYLSLDGLDSKIWSLLYCELLHTVTMIWILIPEMILVGMIKWNTFNISVFFVVLELFRNFNSGSSKYGPLHFNKLMDRQMYEEIWKIESGLLMMGSDLKWFCLTIRF